MTGQFTGGTHRPNGVSGTQRKLLRKKKAEQFLPLDNDALAGDHSFLERDVPDGLFRLFYRLRQSEAIREIGSLESYSRQIGVYQLHEGARDYLKAKRDERQMDDDRPQNPCGCPFAKTHGGGLVVCPRCNTRWAEGKYHQQVRAINGMADRPTAVTDGGETQ